MIAFLILGNADFSEDQMNTYLDDVESKSAAGAIAIGYTNLPLKAQFHFQQKLGGVQKGTVVDLHNGEKFDTRYVPNGSGGKRNHRTKNNRLNEDGDEEAVYQQKLKEVFEYSKVDKGGVRKAPIAIDEWVEIYNGEEKRKLVYFDEYDNKDGKAMKQVFVKKEKEVIEIDESSNEEGQKEMPLNAKKDALVEKMFVRVGERMNKKYTYLLKKKGIVNDSVEKKRIITEKNELKRIIKKYKKEKDKGEHIEFIKMLTSDGDDLMSPNEVDSPAVMKLVFDEYSDDDAGDDDDEKE